MPRANSSKKFTRSKFIRTDRFLVCVGTLVYLLVQISTQSQVLLFQDTTALFEEILSWKLSAAGAGRRLGSGRRYMSMGGATLGQPHLMSHKQPREEPSEQTKTNSPQNSTRKQIIRAARGAAQLRRRRARQKQRKAVLQEDRRLHPIFYNVYVPPDNYKNALLIAQEQMRQRKMLTPNATLFYTLIGSPKVSPQFCEPNCYLREYLEQGHEVETQQAIWEYCQDRPDEWVTYLHDKGSLHDNENNKRARRIATRAALACRKLLLHRNPNTFDWNICGAGFNVLPQFQGNAK